MTTSLERSTRIASYPPRSKSGLQGVYRHKRTGKWTWDAQWRGQRLRGTHFDTMEEAAAAREKAIRQAWPDRVAMTK